MNQSSNCSYMFNNSYSKFEQAEGLDLKRFKPTLFKESEGINRNTFKHILQYWFLSRLKSL